MYVVLIKLSVGLNRCLNGEPDQTFSARNYQRRLNNLPNLCTVIDLLLFEKNHCEKCWSRWIERQSEQ